METNKEKESVLPSVLGYIGLIFIPFFWISIIINISAILTGIFMESKIKSAHHRIGIYVGTILLLAQIIMILILLGMGKFDSYTLIRGLPYVK